jgi:hypothetical protein
MIFIIGSIVIFNAIIIFIRVGLRMAGISACGVE